METGMDTKEVRTLISALLCRVSLDNKLSLRSKGFFLGMAGASSFCSYIFDSEDVKMVSLHSSNGRHSTHESLKELIANGYVLKIRERSCKGTFTEVTYKFNFQLVKSEVE
jgi:hypothetical protein